MSMRPAAVCLYHESPTRGENNTCVCGTSPTRTPLPVAMALELKLSLAVGVLKIRGSVTRTPYVSSRRRPSDQRSWR